MKKIIITNKRNQGLSAVLHESVNQTDKILIFTHSFKSDKDTDYVAVDFAKTVCAEGYAFLRFDFWGSGESDGDFEESSVNTQIDDLKDVIEYIKTQGYSNICLVGLSLGTTISIMAYDDAIRCMILWSPSFHLISRHERYRDEINEKGYVIEENGLTGKEFKIGKMMWQDFKDVNPVLSLNKIKCPVLTIVGSEDDSIELDKTRKYLDMILAEQELVVIDGGGHDFLIEEAKKELLQISSNFIKKYL